MKTRSGQVAVYLVLVLVAITFLVLMNVGTYLGVSARNTTMNGGDAAALAVAHYQGVLLNRIGSLNREHLKALIEGDVTRCASITTEQMRCCFLGPLDGIARGNAAAANNGCSRNDFMLAVLKQHVSDIRRFYVKNPDAYPEPWPGAWEEYAHELDLALAKGLWAGPDNIDFIDAATGHLLLTRAFYSAIASEDWCWFFFHAPGLLSNYSSFRDWGPLPGSDPETRHKKCINSEVYSLNLELRSGSALELLGLDTIKKITGASDQELNDAKLLGDARQVWFFFSESAWHKWWEIAIDGDARFPAMGAVKSAYDVRGCAAVCRVTCDFLNVVQEGDVREAVWSAAAKPFGVLESDDGGSEVVTALNGFVTDAFTTTRLVPLDSVGASDLSTIDPAWMNHVRKHLPDYLKNGPRRGLDCHYCHQLVRWENDFFRAKGDRWLRYHSHECVRPASGPGPGGSGGSAHGH